MQVQACDKCHVLSTEATLLYLTPHFHWDMSNDLTTKPKQGKVIGFSISMFQSRVDESTLTKSYCPKCLGEVISETLAQLGQGASA